MRKIVVAAIISLAAGCDGGPTGPTVDARVSGRVLDYATSGGVPGAAVAFGDSTAVTDTNGSYSLVIAVSLVAGKGISGVVRVDVELKRL